MGILRAAVTAFAMVSAAGAAMAAEGNRLTVVVAGDAGFNASGGNVSPAGGFKHGQLLKAEESLAGIAPWLRADVTVVNLETVVTDDSSLGQATKRFVFRTHPAAVRAFVAAGVNVFSLANNHALDFGTRGAGDTLRHLEAMRLDGLQAFPGAGRTRDDAAAPHLFEIRDTTVAASSIGIGGWGVPSPDGHAGMLRYPADFDAVTGALSASRAALRILSVHYGPEFEPKTDAGTQTKFREAVGVGGFTIIAGHHKHVASGIERVGDNGVVFYGLGNFLHLGMQNMGRFDICRDFGLLAKLHLREGADGQLYLEAVEAVPLTDMHRRVTPMADDDAALRLDVLNDLSARLADDPEQAFAFSPRNGGSGLWCAADATLEACAGWAPPAPPPAARSISVAAACNKHVSRATLNAQ